MILIIIIIIIWFIGLKKLRLPGLKKKFKNIILISYFANVVKRDDKKEEGEGGELGRGVFNYSLIKPQRFIILFHSRQILITQNFSRI